MKDYSELYFNEKNSAKLMENKEKIINWMRENIVANMEQNSSLECSIIYKDQKLFDLCVEKFDDEEYKILYNNSYSEGIFSWEKSNFEEATSKFIFKLIDNWDTTKDTLFYALDKLIKLREKIYNFEV